MSADGITMTRDRLAWLDALATNGASNLVDLPKTARGYLCGPATWRPLVRQGFIVHDIIDGESVFTITATGRLVLSKAMKGAAS